MLPKPPRRRWCLPRIIPNERWFLPWRHRRAGIGIAVATMTLTLSINHRAVDGATAARFLTRLKELIEEPLGIVL